MWAQRLELVPVYPLIGKIDGGTNLKRLISLRTQYIIMCIPFVNCLILFIWLYNYSRTTKEPKVFAKSLLVIFATALPVVILQILLSKAFSQSVLALNILNFIMIYIIPFLIGFSLIKYQKRTLGDYFSNNS